MMRDADARPDAPDYPRIEWIEDGQPRSARWRSESGMPPPQRVQIADDTINADSAYRLVCEGTALLWRGDFQNARQLLQALARRIDRPAKTKRSRPDKIVVEPQPAQAFHLHRQAQSQRARTLAMLVLPFEADHVIPLRRAPDIRQACSEAYDAHEVSVPTPVPAPVPYVASMRELLGLIGAYEWRKNGVQIAALDGRIHPHYGVFAPVRSEYIDLVAAAPLPNTALAFDIGTGTGVLAALLIRRGVQRVVATDLDARALACAHDNLLRLGLTPQVELLQTDLFPPGRASLIVCNPPWLPARPSSTLEHAIYDPDNRMLRGFLQGLQAHLTPDGEAWLILSDLAEHLGLRSRAFLHTLFAEAGVRLIAKHDVRPHHPRASDRTDALHAARAAELTSLWRLALLPQQSPE